MPSEINGPLRIAAFSCDCVNAKGRGTGLIKNMWEKFWDETVSKGDVDCVIHLGDQVYADEAFDKGASREGLAEG